MTVRIKDGLIALWRTDRAVPHVDVWGGYSLARHGGGASRSRAGVAGQLAEDINTTVNTNDSLKRSTSDAAFGLSPSKSGTASVWVWLDALPASEATYPMAHWNGSTDWVMSTSTVGGAGFSCQQTDAVTKSATTPVGFVRTGAWNLYVGWYDHTAGTYGTVYLQINNTDICSTALTNTKSTGSAQLWLGSIHDTFGKMDGAICMPMFHPRALTAEERAWLWNGGRGRNPLAPERAAPLRGRGRPPAGQLARVGVGV